MRESALSKASAGESIGRLGKPVTEARVSILLADDHTLIRQGIRTLLESESELEVVGESGDGRQAVKLALQLRPDVVLMDIAMPLLNGIEATRQILTALPETKVLVLSAHRDEEYVDRVLALGAVGYVLKQSSLVELATAIRTVQSGRVYVSPLISRRVRRRPGRTRESGGRPPVPTHLTSREAEVLQLISEGVTNKQTANLLGISVKTVEKHRNGLMQKLDIHDVAGLVRYAVSVGIIEGRDRSAAD